MRFYCALAMMTILMACSAKKAIKKVNKAELPSVLTGMTEHYTDYTWFSGRARVKFEGSEMRLSGRCNIRMIRDSLIWMNFKKLSIEASRVLITRDSFWIVYRLDKLYESGTLEELLSAYEIDLSFEELQELVVGNFPVPSKNSVRSFTSDKFHELFFQLGFIRYRYRLDNEFRLAEVMVNDEFDRQIYGKFENYNEQGIASFKEFFIDLEEGGQGKISFDFSSLEIDQPKSIPFDVPEHYIRLP